MPIILDTPPGAPFVEVHIWIGHYADGSEGMLGGDLMLPDGLGPRFMPLMNSKREVCEIMAPLARNLQSASQHAPNRIVRVELRTFRAVTS